MADEEKVGLDTLVQGKIEADTDFQDSLTEMSDEDKESATTIKKSEVAQEVFATLKDKSDKDAELAGNYKIRAEKAEKLKGEKKEGGEAKVEEGLSQSDVIFIAKSDIHEDDIEEVTDYAKLKGVPAKEAYEYLKPRLDVKNEERKTAEATQSKGGARGATKSSGEDNLRKAEKTGEVPDTDKGMVEMAEARMARKKARQSE